MNTLTEATHVVSWQPEAILDDPVFAWWAVQTAEDHALGLIQCEDTLCLRAGRDCDLFDLAAWVSAALGFPVILTEIAPMRVYGVTPAAAVKAVA